MRRKEEARIGECSKRTEVVGKLDPMISSDLGGLVGGREGGKSG
jgi:hypothetical protein